MEVVWSKEAKESLGIIYTAVFKNSPQNALIVIDTLLNLGNSLENSKVEYAKEPIINKEKFRFISKWSYKIIYERTKKRVVILDVVQFKTTSFKNETNQVV